MSSEGQQIHCYRILRQPSIPGDILSNEHIFVSATKPQGA